MPKVYNKYHQDAPAGAIYIGRPTKWGNPFVIGKDGTRDEVIEKYREWLLANPKLMELARGELSGKDLVCYCAPKACHGDVLMEIVNMMGGRMKHPEHEQQCFLVQWAKLNERKYPDLKLLYANANAGKRSPRQGAWMKAEGMKAGVPDLCLPVARGKYHAMYIELKVPPNKPTKEQAVWIENLRAQGCLSIVAYDWHTAAKAIEAYLELR